MSQIIKSHLDKKILYDFLIKFCTIDKKYLIFSKTAFKKSKMSSDLTDFIETIKPYYYKSKQKYLTRELNYKNFITILRQLCNYLKIPYTSKICYQKSKYEIIYYINFEEELFKLNNTTNNDISVITSPKNEIVKEKND